MYFTQTWIAALHFDDDHDCHVHLQVSIVVEVGRYGRAFSPPIRKVIAMTVYPAV